MLKSYLLGAVLLVPAAGAVYAWDAADTTLNYTQVAGRIDRVERECQVERRDRTGPVKTRETSSWIDCLAAEREAMGDPKAEIFYRTSVTVRYFSPVDNSEQTASYRFNGDPETARALTRGAEIAIYASKSKHRAIKPVG